jgi:hypothetical protein
MGSLATALGVLQQQLVQQVLEMGWQTGRLGSQVLPQPVSDNLADRRAGRTVDVHGSIGVSVGHCGSASRSIQLGDIGLSPAVPNCFRFFRSRAFPVNIE